MRACVRTYVCVCVRVKCRQWKCLRFEDLPSKKGTTTTRREVKKRRRRRSRDASPYWKFKVVNLKCLLLFKTLSFLYFVCRHVALQRSEWISNRVREREVTVPHLPLAKEAAKNDNNNRRRNCERNSNKMTNTKAKRVTTTRRAATTAEGTTISSGKRRSSSNRTTTTATANSFWKLLLIGKWRKSNYK